MSLQFRILLGFLGSVVLVTALAIFSVVTIDGLSRQMGESKTSVVSSVANDARLLEKANEVISLSRRIASMKTASALQRFSIDQEIDGILGESSGSVGLPENLGTEISQVYLARKNYLELRESLPEELSSLENRADALYEKFERELSGKLAATSESEDLSKEIEIARRSLTELSLATSKIISGAQRTVAFDQDDKAFGRFEERVMKSIAAAQASFASLGESLAAVPGGEALAEKLMERYGEILIGFVDEDGLSLQLEQLSIKSNSVEAAQANLFASIRSIQEESIARSHAIVDGLESNLGGVVERSKRASRTIIWICVGAVILSVVVGVWIPKVVTRQLAATSDRMNDVTLALSSAAEQVAAASGVLAVGSDQQSSSLQETFTSLQDIARRSEENTQSVSKTVTATRSAREEAESGVNEMLELEEAMKSIQKSSAETVDIIGTIEEIAFQTNILALNAAVEAARAGTAGAGFAVVADEVRNLAQRASKAAQETGSKIELAIESSERGVSISYQAKERLASIVSRIQEADSYVDVINAAAREQTTGIAQTTGAMREMEQVTLNTASSAKQTAEAATSLEDQSTRLRSAVDDLQALLRGRRSRRESAAVTKPSLDKPQKRSDFDLWSEPKREKVGLS
ncbi:methyl-accepting chemotaxis protein [Pelagicoccus sp. SDUM812003]|uniref:methyl-accepting chemotaxis protein n=1 Tax=Pelagicoccus sp. SDUM812003 TaxID=3041267 RepID=UPI00280CCC2A|nr:methyl-accepting chemotaxis protein [Pelagicoccus sp. SDUM812003]MDQ8205145.1 methyl-accepting chemotaxis protein [Pelagicoccus sp. SDUM812003]